MPWGSLQVRYPWFLPSPRAYYQVRRCPVYAVEILLENGRCWLRVAEYARLAEASYRADQLRFSYSLEISRFGWLVVVR